MSGVPLALRSCGSFCGILRHFAAYCGDARRRTAPHPLLTVSCCAMLCEGYLFQGTSKWRFGSSLVSCHVFYLLSLYFVKVINWQINWLIDWLICSCRKMSHMLVGLGLGLGLVIVLWDKVIFWDKVLTEHCCLMRFFCVKSPPFNTVFYLTPQR